MAFGFPFITNKRRRNVVKIAVLGGDSHQLGCHIGPQFFSKTLYWNLQPPSTRDHQLAVGNLAENALKQG
jgi:hypothetical protein